MELDAAVTIATVHHWEHIPQVALMLRRNLKPGGLWFCVREFVANTPMALRRQLDNHLLWTRLNTYEWPYPASAYADLITYTGFQLVAVLPQFYEENAISGTAPPVPRDYDLKNLNAVVDEALQTNSLATVDSFWAEVDYFRNARHGNRIYTMPQMFVFRRTEPY